MVIVLFKDMRAEDPEMATMRKNMSEATSLVISEGSLLWLSPCEQYIN